MAVNEPSPRAKPGDKVCLHYHKSLATHAITIICLEHLIGPCGTVMETHSKTHHDNFVYQFV